MKTIAIIDDDISAEYKSGVLSIIVAFE